MPIISIYCARARGFSFPLLSDIHRKVIRAYGVHDEERNVAMLRRACEALRPGGTMVVLDLERAEPGKRGTQIGTLTGLLFYVTSHARTYSGRELEGFLEAAGFERVRLGHRELLSLALRHRAIRAARRSPMRAA